MRIAAALTIALLLAGCAAQPASDKPEANKPENAKPATAAATPGKLLLTEWTLEGLKEFQSKIGSTGHGYFAVTADGSDYAYWYCPGVSCTGQRSELKRKALQRCHEQFPGTDCVIFAEDQDIVLDYQTYPIALPPPAAGEQTASVQTPAAARPAPPPTEQMAAVGRPGWAVDDLHGCWVWNIAPEKADVVTWTGACAADGTANGDGMLEWKDSERYTGPMKNGRKDGQGKTVNAYGDSYAGGFKAGEHDGHGKYIWSDGASYEGEYTNGYPNGSGVFSFRNDVYSGEWKNGCFNDGTKKYRILNRKVAGCSL